MIDIVRVRSASSDARGRGASSHGMFVGWGLGTLGTSLLLSAVSLFLLRYLTDFIGIGAGIASGLIALAKLYDALTDPLIGRLSDRTGGASGRRRPWLLFGGLAMTMSLPIMFNIPTTLSTTWATAYAAAALFFYSSSYSAFAIPYIAMPTEMTQNFNERSYMMSWRVAASGLGTLAASLLGAMLIERLGGGLRGHQGMSLILAPLVFLSALTAYWATRDAPFVVRGARSTVPLREQIRSGFGNRPLLIFLGIKFLTLMMLGVGAAYAFFFTLVLHKPITLLGLFIAGATVMMIMSQPLWLYLARRWGKRLTLQLALAVVVVSSLSWFVARPSDLPLPFIVRALLSGVGNGGILCAGQAMLPDVLEYDQVRTGLRREGLLAGVYTVIEKLSSAVGIAMVGAILQLMGYVSHRAGAASAVQPASALLGVRIAVSFVPAALCSLSFILLFFYNLTPDMIRDLRDREDEVGDTTAAAN